MTHEDRAPGWNFRCLNCGLSEPAGKYIIRQGGAGRSYTIGWCPRCRWIRCHAIERAKQGSKPSKPTETDGLR